MISPLAQRCYVGIMESASILAGVVFFSSRRRHTRYWRDWSSDVCSSDLLFEDAQGGARVVRRDRLKPRPFQRKRQQVDQLAIVVNQQDPHWVFRPVGVRHAG